MVKSSRMKLNKDNLPLFFLILAAIMVGFLIGRMVGISQTNNYYYREEVKQQFCENLNLPQKVWDLPQNIREISNTTINYKTK